MRALPNLTTWLTALCLWAGLLVGPAGAAAPEPIRTRHFVFHPADGTERGTERLASDAEARYDALCAMLRSCELTHEPINVWLAEDAEGFARVFPDGAPMAEWAVGVAFPAERRVVLRAHGSALFSVRETFDHELSHVLLNVATGGQPVPRWFNEGIAIWQSGEAVLRRLVDAQRAARADRLIPLAELERGFPAQGPAVGLAYAESALFVHWLEREYGLGAIPELLADMRRGIAFGAAFDAAFGAPVVELEALWRQDLERASTRATVLGDPNFFWGLMSLLFLWASWVRWRQQRMALASMADDEAREDALVWGDPTEPPTLH